MNIRIGRPGGLLVNSGRAISPTELDGLEGRYFARSPQLEQGPYKPIEGDVLVEELARMSSELDRMGVGEAYVYIQSAGRSSDGGE